MENKADKVEQIVCLKCLGTIQLVNGRGTCKHCGYIEYPKIEDTDSKIASRIRNIAHERDAGFFDRALEDIIVEISNGNKSSEIYFQQLLANFGIRYVEENGEAIPTISRLSDYDIKEHASYKLAIEAARSEYKDGNAAAEQIENEVNKIDEIRRKSLAISKNTDPFDVFICFKHKSVLDMNANTEDYGVALEIYRRLTDKYGYKVFFSKETLNAGDDYEPVIFRALSTAKVMLVISATKPQIIGTKHINYLESPWVKNEWSRYLGMMKRENKTNPGSKHIVPVLANGVRPEDLPGELNGNQALVYDPSFFDKLSKKLEEWCPPEIGNKFAKASIIKRDVEKVEIKKKAIVRRTMGSYSDTYTLTPEIKEVIDSARDDINRRNYRRARSYIDAELEIKDFSNNGELNWLGFLAYLEVSDSKEFAQKRLTIADDETKERLRNYLLKSVEGDGVDDDTAHKVLDAVRELAQCSLSYGDVTVFEELYNFLANYLSEKQQLQQARKFAEEFINILSNSSENGLGNFTKQDIEHLYFDVFYPAFSIGGADEIISAYDSISTYLNSINEFELSTKFTDKVLELYELDENAIFVKFLNQYKISFSKTPDSYTIVYNVNNNEKTLFVENLKKALTDTFSSKDFKLNVDEEINLLNYAFGFVYTYIHGCEESLLNKGIELFKMIYSFVPNNKEYQDFAADCCKYFAVEFLSCGTDASYGIVKDLCQEYITSFGTDSFDIFLLQLLADNKFENIYELLVSGIDFEDREYKKTFSSMNAAAYADKSKKNTVWKELVDLIDVARKGNEIKYVFNEAAQILRKTNRYMSLDNVLKIGVVDRVYKVFEYPVNDGYIAYFHNDYVFDYKFVGSSEEKLSQEDEWANLSSARENYTNTRNNLFESRKKSALICVLFTIVHMFVAAIIAFVFGYFLRNAEQNFQLTVVTGWSEWIQRTYWIIFVLFVIFCGAATYTLSFYGSKIPAKVLSNRNDMELDEFYGDRFAFLCGSGFGLAAMVNAVANKIGVGFPFIEIVAFGLPIMLTHYSKGCRNKITGFWLPYLDLVVCVGLVFVSRSII